MQASTGRLASWTSASAWGFSPGRPKACWELLTFGQVGAVAAMGEGTARKRCVGESFAALARPPDPPQYILYPTIHTQASPSIKMPGYERHKYCAHCKQKHRGLFFSSPGEAQCFFCCDAGRSYTKREIASEDPMSPCFVQVTYNLTTIDQTTY